MFKKLKYNLKNKKAFTLIEILMVIVIVGILMGATMRFGGDRIGFLNNKNIKEQFVSNYDNLFSNNMMTSYHMGEPYASLNIDFVLGSSGLNYLYKGYKDFVIFSDIKGVDGGEYKIIELSINGKEKESVNISLVPYVLGCNINGLEDQIVNLGIMVNDSKNYCFEINSDNCRIDSILCK